jgi:hypothetical protein
MKKILLSILVLTCVYGGVITKTFYFSPTALNFEKIGDYDIVSYHGLSMYVEKGKPVLPQGVYYILIPSDATVTEIRIKEYEEVPLVGSYYLYPGPDPVPVSVSNIPTNAIPDIEIYRQELFPQEIIRYTSTGTKSGFRIASFALFPVRYYPQEKKISLISKITIEVIWQENEVIPEVLTPDQYEVFKKDVKTLVINPEDLERFSPPRISKQNEIDCLIITYDGLVNNLVALKEWHNKKGYRTEFLTTTDINNNYSGRDLQEKIRKAIINYYENYGLKWVILAGDNNYLPTRRAYAVVNTSPPTIGNIPCDLYFSDLQWSWDGNNNNIFGEAGVDTVDFFADVYVGRLSVENTSEVNNILNKINIYEKNPDSLYLNRILLPAAYLWQNYNHMISQDSISNLLPSNWIYRKINLGQNDGLRYLVRDSINNGFGLAHLVGHGDDVGVYIYNSPQYYVSDPQTQTNANKLVIVNSIACYPGNFEYSDCLAERMLNASNCAVAVMMNSRYGWGTPPVIGPSELLDISFYRRFFSDDSIFLGSTFSTSKDIYRYYAETQQVWRWCVFELNLFGDPLIPLWKSAPIRVSLSYPDTIYTGPQNIQVLVTRNMVPVSGVTVGIYKPNEVYARARTNSQGIATLFINPTTDGLIYLTASGAGILPQEESTQVIWGSALPYLTLRRLTINQLEINQNNQFSVIIQNVGNASATNVTGILGSNNNYISIVDSISNYGALAAGDTNLGDNFTVFVSAQIPAGTIIPFVLVLNADQGNWNINFEIRAGLPPVPGMIYAEHDTGYCLLGVTAQGSIGYTQPNEKIGQGFRYPKSASSQLYYASILVGNSASYIVDRFYGQPASSTNTDFRVLESLRFIFPPIMGAEQLVGSYTDAGHPTPLGLKVIQRSYMSDALAYDDFVILEFEYQNPTQNSINNLYSGIIADFDIVASSATSDIARTDANRRLAYMRQAATQNPTVGVKLLYPSSYANLTVIDHDRYVYPDSAMTESMKYRILNGGISLSQSNRTYDWSVGVSCGPFNLPPGGTYRVVYAFIGGNSEATFLANADSAQAYYDRLAGIVENSTDADKMLLAKTIMVKSNFLSQEVVILNNNLTDSNLTIKLYDIMGKKVLDLAEYCVLNKESAIRIRIPKLSSGIYFLKISDATRTATAKLLVIR